MIKNPTLKQLVEAAEQGKRIRCNACSCDGVIGRLYFTDCGTSIWHENTRPYHLGNTYELAFFDKGIWKWMGDSKRIRRNLIILDD